MRSFTKSLCKLYEESKLLLNLEEMLVCYCELASVAVLVCVF